MKYLRSAGLLIGLAAVPGSVLAHPLASGGNQFMAGFMHTIYVPAHLISLIAVGLLLGQQGPNRHQLALIMYPVVALMGLVMSVSLGPLNLETLILLAAMVMGLLIVLSPRLPIVWSAAVSACTGLIIGLDSSQYTATGMLVISAMFGAGVGIVLLPLLAMEFADYFRRIAWQRIGIRILGSWIAASAFLVLALTFTSKKI